MKNGIATDGQPVSHAPDDAPAEQLSVAEEAYSVFTASHRRTITGLLSTASLISPLTATIYLPLIPLLASHFDVSIQAINLTITLYIVFQAIAPVLLSTHSDTFGRRPIYLATFSIYTIASLGLALNHSSYGGLLALRALQSLGSSAVLSVCYGSVADLVPSSARGKMLGPVMASSNLGTALGPVVGGVIAYGSGSVWWAFWALFIFGATMLVALGALMPETARKIVGNGSTQDRRWNWPLIDFILPNRRHKTSDSISSTVSDLPKHKLHFRSPLHAFRLIFYADTALTLCIVGTCYALWYTIQASIPLIFAPPPYDFNEFQTGLAYLPGAFGVIVCMYATGLAMDHNYRVVVTRFKATSNPSDSAVPLERARSRFTIPLALLLLICTIGYGWTVHYHAHPAIPLVLQCVLGFLVTWLLNVFNALLVDVFPEAPSAAATAGNLARCGMSAAMVAALEPGVRGVGRGWFWTILGLGCGGGATGCIWALDRWGMGWRLKRNKGESL